MRVVVEHRAARVLQNLARALDDPRPFLLPSNICRVVPASLTAAGRRIRFVDISGHDLVMDRERCLSLMAHDRDGFAGVVFVRTYGVETTEEPFFASLKQASPRTLLIDDKCLCRPDCIGDTLAPSADVTIFSTGHAKHVDLGSGGFGHLADGVAYREETSSGMPTPIWADYRDRIACALAEADQHKRKLNDIYHEGIPQDIQFPKAFQHWRFNIRVDDSARLVESLFAAGLFASRHYPPATGTFSNRRFPVAEQLHGRVVNLFNDRYYTEDQARQTVEVVRRHLAVSS